MAWQNNSITAYFVDYEAIAKGLLDFLGSNMHKGVTGIIARNPTEVIAMQPAYCLNQPIAVARIKERVVWVVARLLPVTYAVASILLVAGVIVIWADLVKPITLTG